MTSATLPSSLVIDGVTHVQMWRSENFVILQNYDPDSVYGAGRNCRVKLYEVLKKNPGEELGELLLTTTSLTHAIDHADRVAKEGVT